MTFSLDTELNMLDLNIRRLEHNAKRKADESLQKGLAMDSIMKRANLKNKRDKAVPKV